jgi:hypothetical protein
MEILSVTPRVSTALTYAATVGRVTIRMRIVHPFDDASIVPI